MEKNQDLYPKGKWSKTAKKAAKKAAKKTVKKATKKTVGNLTPKRTMGPHDGFDLHPLDESAGRPASAAKPNAVDGYMNFPPPTAKPTPKK